MSQPLSPTLNSEPSVAESSKLHNVELGRWTEIADRCVLNNVQVGDYSYIQNDCNLMFTEIGKFTSIAAAVRLNPSNHPWWRPTLHHFTYRPGKYQLGEDPTSLTMRCSRGERKTKYRLDTMCGLVTALSCFRVLRLAMARLSALVAW